MTARAAENAAAKHLGLVGVVTFHRLGPGEDMLARSFPTSAARIVSIEEWNRSAPFLRTAGGHAVTFVTEKKQRLQRPAACATVCQNNSEVN